MAPYGDTVKGLTSDCTLHSGDRDSDDDSAALLFYEVIPHSWLFERSHQCSISNLSRRKQDKEVMIVSESTTPESLLSPCLRDHQETVQSDEKFRLQICHLDPAGKSIKLDGQGYRLKDVVVMQA